MMATWRSIEKRRNELVGGKRAQIVDALADAYESERQRTLPGDGAHHAALGGAVELGENQPGETERLIERLELTERVLPGIGVQHEPNFVRGAGLRLGDGALDLLRLFHQVQLRGEPPGRVGDDHVDPARARRGDRVEDHRSGIAARLGGYRG